MALDFFESTERITGFLNAPMADHADAECDDQVVVCKHCKARRFAPASRPRRAFRCENCKKRQQAEATRRYEAKNAADVRERKNAWARKHQDERNAYWRELYAKGRIKGRRPRCG